jgi:hypothetical protein
VCSFPWAPLTSTLEPKDMASLPRHARTALSAYLFALVMALIAIVPGCNFLYSGHGGVAWLVLPFVFPMALCRLALWWYRAPRTERPIVLRYSLASVLIYLVAAFGFAYAGANSIQHTFGLRVEPAAMWGMFTVPIGLSTAHSFFGF